MKSPQPDITKTAVDDFVAKTGANRKLKKLWGTTSIDGVEVLNHRRHYHKEADRPANYERLFKFLKVYNDVKDYEGEGIKSAWFTLNKSNGPEDLTVDPLYIASNLNTMWWNPLDGDVPEGLTLTTTITIGLGFNSTSGTYLIDRSTLKEDQAIFVKDNYETFWSDNIIEQEGIGVINKGTIFDEEYQVVLPDNDDLSPDDPWLSILSRYILRDDASGIPCVIKDIEVGIGKNGRHLYNTAVVTIEIPYHEFSASDPIVQRIHDDLSQTNFPKPFKNFRSLAFNGFMTMNEHITQASAKQVTYYEEIDDIDGSFVNRPYIQWENATTEASVYNNFWHKSGDVWYFKADVINDPKNYGTNHNDLNTYLFSLLDTGYQKEKIPFWKKYVAFVIFVIAVVVTYLSFGTMTGWTAPIMAAAAAVVTGALVLSLVMLVLSAIGMNEWAMAFASVSKAIEPLVTVATIILIVDMIGQAATEIAKKGVQEYVKTALIDMATDFAIGISEAMAGTISLKAALAINKVVTLYNIERMNKLESINSRNIDLKAQYDKIVEESVQETDVIKSYMNIYAKPATADWSVYAKTFDFPYERGGGMLATGNIQKTTKQAIRKADYNERMFESMNLA